MCFRVGNFANLISAFLFCLLGISTSADAGRVVLNCVGQPTDEEFFSGQAEGQCSGDFGGISDSASGSGFETAGNLRASASAALQTASSAPQDGTSGFGFSGPTALTQVIYTDTITIEAPTAGIARLPVSVNGTLFAQANNAYLSRSPTTASAGIAVDGFLGGNINLQELLESYVGDNTQTRIFIDDTLMLETAFNPGQPFALFIEGRATASCSVPNLGRGSALTTGLQCQAAANFGNSLTFDPIIILDSQGSVITDATVTSTSGFNYVVGFVGEVPAPQLTWLPVAIAALTIRVRAKMKA